MVYKDYVVHVPNGSLQQNMWLALHPDPFSKPDYYDVTLSGVEIFKVNGTNGNLAGPNPIFAPKQDLIDPTRARPSSSHGKPKNQKAIIIGVVTGGIVLAFVIGFFVIASYHCQHGKDSSAREVPSRWHQEHGHGKDSSARGVPSWWHQEHGRGFTKNFCRCFSFAEIKVATKDFDEALLLGFGGFGKVYKGEINDGATKVAIKRGNPFSVQGVHEFQTKIEMLSKVRHHHLVSLIGYCEDSCEMILVYDYMSHGTLCEHLYNTQKPPLPRKQRLEICIGATRDFHYLHTGAKHTITH